MGNNQNLNEEQLDPVIEKISISDLDQERATLELEDDSSFNKLIKTMLALNDEDKKKAIIYMKEKIEILEKLNNKK